jgi:uncharacterized RDD family membrane protein YckC
MSEPPIDGAGVVSAESSPSNPVAPALARRMACWLYEGMLLFAVVFMAGWLFSTLGQMRSGMDPRRPLLQLFVFIVWGVYFAWFWSRGRQTLAMKTWRIGLVDAAGQPLTQQRAAWRYVCCWLWFLPPLAAVSPLHLGGRADALAITGWIVLWALSSRLHPQRQFWHDVLAGTRLVPVDRG